MAGFFDALKTKTEIPKIEINPPAKTEAKSENPEKPEKPENNNFAKIAQLLAELANEFAELSKKN